jgi:hypothetical protein
MSCLISLQFLRKTQRDVKSSTSGVSVGIFGKSEHYTVTKVTEYHWALQCSWEFVVFKGNDLDSLIVLAKHASDVEVKTVVEASPQPEVAVQPPVDLQLTWLLHHLDRPRSQPVFRIDRANGETCRTPSRNAQVNEALQFTNDLHGWASRVQVYVRDRMLQLDQHSSDLDAGSLRRLTDSVFVPVLPVLEVPSQKGTSLLLERMS